MKRVDKGWNSIVGIYKAFQNNLEKLRCIDWLNLSIRKKLKFLAYPKHDPQES